MRPGQKYSDGTICLQEPTFCPYHMYFDDVMVAGFWWDKVMPAIPEAQGLNMIDLTNSTHMAMADRTGSGIYDGF